MLCPQTIQIYVPAGDPRRMWVTDMEALWPQEADDRLAAYRRGEIRAVPLSAVLAKYQTSSAAVFDRPVPCATAVAANQTKTVHAPGVQHIHSVPPTSAA